MDSAAEKAHLQMMRDRRMQILAENQAKLMENQAMIMHSMVALSKRIDGINEQQFEREARALCRTLEHVNGLIEDGIFAMDPH